MPFVRKLQITYPNGLVHSIADPSQQISYAELIGGRYFDSKVDWNGKTASALAVNAKVPLKTPDQLKVIGQSFRRRDLPGKVFGTLDMVNDVRLPGMLHARMIRPKVAGAVPVKVDEGSIAQVTGARVVWIKHLLAVVAEKEWNAVKAARALKVTWSESRPGFPGDERLFEHIRKVLTQTKGLLLVLRESDTKTFLRQALNGKQSEYHLQDLFDTTERLIS